MEELCCIFYFLVIFVLVMCVGLWDDSFRSRYEGLYLLIFGLYC